MFTVTKDLQAEDSPKSIIENPLLVITKDYVKKIATSYEIIY